MIKRGVSLYSYQQEQFFKRMTLRDMVKEVHDNLKTDGIEIIDQAVVRQYPYPSDEFVAEFRDLMAEFDMTAVTMDIYLDTLQFRDHVMTHKEAAERLVRDIRLAAKLGFQNVRCLCSVPIDVIEMALPAAEEYGVRIGKEIHAPFNIKTDSGEQYGKGDGFPRNPKMCEEIINLAEKKHTKFVGLVPDMGIFQRSINRPQFAYAVRHGANPDALRMVDRIAAEGVRDPAVARERLLALGFSEKDTTVARQVGMFSQVDPREMRDIVPYIVSIHGKFYEMTEILIFPPNLKIPPFCRMASCFFVASQRCENPLLQTSSIITDAARLLVSFIILNDNHFSGVGRILRIVLLFHAHFI